MPGRSLTIEQVLTLLAATPPRLAALTADLSPAQLHTRPTPDEWSANEVLAHHGGKRSLLLGTHGLTGITIESL